MAYKIWIKATITDTETGEDCDAGIFTDLVGVQVEFEKLEDAIEALNDFRNGDGITQTHQNTL